MKKNINYLWAIAVVMPALWGCTQIPGDLGRLEYNPAKRTMVRINGGTFQMGQAGVATPVHQVTVSSFLMDNTDVTQGDYQAVMNVNPSYFFGDSLRPVEQVTWYDAVLYCNSRSKLAGLDTVYSFSLVKHGASNECDSLGNLVIDYSKKGYRLPTEAEWEYACRAGSTSLYYWGDAMDLNYCWDTLNSGGRPHRVGQKTPNDFGLYDMSGNVWQWCNDWFGVYGSASQTDPVGPATGARRILRGGSWLRYDYALCAAYRASDVLGKKFYDVGFRCVLDQSMLPPVLSSPANGAAGQSQPLTLSWFSVGNATGYYVQVSTNDSFTTVVFEDTGLIPTSTTRTVSGLSGGVTYYWRVTAANANEKSDWSAVWSFTTATASLQAPTLLSPMGTATNQPLVLALSWSTVTNATGYHVQVSTSSSFSSVFIEDSTLTVTSRTIGNLAPGTTYYWRVRAKNASGFSAWSGTRSFITAAASPDTMKFIAGGTFTMGSNDGLDYLGSPAHQVTVSSFYMDSALVSQAAYLALMGVNPSSFPGILTRPVEQVTWFDAVLFCNARSKKENRDTVYTFSSISGVIGNGCNGLGNILADFSKNGYRLPTDAEFEYAHRAGTTTPYFWGNDTSAAATYAWWKGNSPLTTQSVATKAPNGWKLYDMSGNVWEWCNDWYALYTSSAQTDPTGPSTGNFRVLRGGSWRDFGGALRSAYRSSGGPAVIFYSYGFRCVRKYSAVVLPQAPTLASPLSGATAQSLPLTLSWSTVANAASYRVQVSSDSTFTTVTVDDSSLVSASKTVDSLLSGVKYFWRVRSKNASGVSGWTTPWSFTTVMPAIPSAPLLVRPANSSTNQSLTPTLGWSKVSGATTYYVQVSTSSTFTIIFFQDSTLTADSIKLAGLATGTTYYWHVRAKNAAGVSAWTTTWSFTTVLLVAPSVPTINLPVNGSTNQSLTPTLDWSTVTYAATYYVQVSTNPIFTAIVFQDSTLTADSVNLATLAPNTLYHWRVRAKNAIGVSAWTSTWTFTTGPAPLPVPVLTSPANGTTMVNPVGIALTWSLVNGATSYRVQVSTDSAFFIVVVDDSTLASGAKTVDFLSPLLRYYWRVRAKNVDGISAWTSPWNFTTISIPVPSVPTLVSPATGSSNQSRRPILTWSSVSGATSYHVQVSANPGFTTVIAVDSTLTVPFKLLDSALSTGTLYFWRVRAKNAAGVSAWTNAWSFTITTTAGPWIARAGLPAAIIYMGVAVVNNKIYAFGGYDGSSYIATMEVYDPGTDKWTTLPNMPTARAPAAAAVNNKIYVIGGGDIGTVQEYDPSTNAWVSKTPMPTVRGPAVTIIGSIIYTVGGYNSISGSLGTNESYNPSSDKWTGLASMTARNSTPVAAAGGKVYAFGGEYWPNTPLNLVQEYDPSGNAWVTKTALPSARTRAAAATVNGKIYVIGGTNDVIDLAEVELYDPSSDKWTAKTAMPTARSGSGIAVVNGKIYVIGGSNISNPRLTTVEEYDPLLDP